MSAKWIIEVASDECSVVLRILPVRGESPGIKIELRGREERPGYRVSTLLPSEEKGEEVIENGTLIAGVYACLGLRGDPYQLGYDADTVVLIRMAGAAFDVLRAA